MPRLRRLPWNRDVIAAFGVASLLDHGILAREEQNASRHKREDVERDADEGIRERVKKCKKTHQAGGNSEKSDNAKDNARPSHADE